jgi:hypothetical protein
MYMEFMANMEAKCMTKLGKGQEQRSVLRFLYHILKAMVSPESRV